MSGAEANKLFGPEAIKDRNFYDEQGNVLDSAMAIKMLKSFDYQMSFSRKSGQEDFKRVIRKIDTAAQAIQDASVKERLRPVSWKLQEGVELDLRPLKKHITSGQLDGKAILLIFWCDGCFGGSAKDAYSNVNEVLSTYMNPDKLEILAITHHTAEQATAALKKNPIVNTRHIVDASNVTSAYGSNNRPIIVLTDKSHKIIYSITDNAMMTPRILDRTLKKML